MACAGEPPSRARTSAACHQRRAHHRGRRAGQQDVGADRGRRCRAPAATRRPRRRTSGRVAAATSAATMAMFQPEIATTWVRPAVAKASLTSGAMPACARRAGCRRRARPPARARPRAGRAGGHVASRPTRLQAGPAIAASNLPTRSALAIGRDPLAGQVFAVGESRRSRAAPRSSDSKLDAVAGLDRDPAREPGQHPAQRAAVRRRRPPRSRPSRTTCCRSPRGRGSSTTGPAEVRARCRRSVRRRCRADRAARVAAPRQAPTWTAASQHARQGAADRRRDPARRAQASNSALARARSADRAPQAGHGVAEQDARGRSGEGPRQQQRSAHGGPPGRG